MIVTIWARNSEDDVKEYLYLFKQIKGKIYNDETKKKQHKVVG